MSAANHRTMPADVKPAKEVAEELNIPYTRLRYWWAKRYIGSWRRGKFRWVSPGEVQAFQQRTDMPRYVEPTGHSKYTDKAE